MFADNKNRLLNEREAAILTTLVHEYIETGKPVGSRTFVQKYSFSLSPATMRNVMSDLEHLEYLKQPYASAGRIPTDKGYRFYVDSLMENYEFANFNDIEIQQKFFSGKIILDEIFKSVTRKLTEVSGYASVMLTPKPDFAVIKRIELIPIDNNDVLMILIARTGMIVTRKFSLSMNVTLDLLREYSTYLTTELSGYSIADMKKGMFDKLRETKINGFNVGMAVDMAELGLSIDEDSDFRVEGIETLLRIPEMTEEGILASLLNIIEEKNILKDIFESTMANEHIRTMIGNEIHDSKVKGCSIVAAPYKIGNTNVGAVGVVGPTRMDYEKVVPVVDYTCKMISELLTEMSK